jgi:hypothetical protein
MKSLKKWSNLIPGISYIFSIIWFVDFFKYLSVGDKPT